MFNCLKTKIAANNFMHGKTLFKLRIGLIVTFAQTTNALR